MEKNKIRGIVLVITVLLTGNLSWSSFGKSKTESVTQVKIQPYSKILDESIAENDFNLPDDFSSNEEALIEVQNAGSRYYYSNVRRCKARTRCWNGKRVSCKSSGKWCSAYYKPGRYVICEAGSPYSKAVDKCGWVSRKSQAHSY